MQKRLGQKRWTSTKHHKIHIKINFFIKRVGQENLARHRKKRQKTTSKLASFSHRFFFDFWYQKPSQKRLKIDKTSIKKRCATRSPQKAPPRRPKASPKAEKGVPNGVVRPPLLCRFGTQDRSKILLGRSWALFPLPKRFLEPLGRLRNPPRALQDRFFDPPGPSGDPPETNFW